MGIAVVRNSLIPALFLPFPVDFLVQIVYFSPSPMRDYFFTTTIICEAPQRFLAQVKLLSSLQQPSRIPRALPHTPPLEMESGFRAAQMLFDIPQNSLSGPPEVLEAVPNSNLANVLFCLSFLVHHTQKGATHGN